MFFKSSLKVGKTFHEARGHTELLGLLCKKLSNLAWSYLYRQMIVQWSTRVCPSRKRGKPRRLDDIMLVFHGLLTY